MADARLQVALRQDTPVPLDVSFGCDAGQVLAVFGPSGSGKTTILRCIAGLHTPRLGHVRCGPHTWLDTASRLSVPVHRRAVGFVSQAYALFPHLSARGNVMAALGHLPAPARQERADRLLASVQLDGRGEARPSALSGGEQQRVALARALAREPAVLLLDEPFAAVDRRVRHLLQDGIDRVRAALDVPLVLVTHDFADVVRLATHLLLLDAGRVVAQGPLDQLTSRPDLTWLREMAGFGSVVDATVARVDETRGLADLTFDGGVLVAPGRDLRQGMRVRVRVPAREVILAREPVEGLSLHNALSGTVAELHASGGDHVVVRVAVGAVSLLAEVTSDAVARLHLVQGRPVHALVKSMSLEIADRGPFAPAASRRSRSV